MSYKDTSGTRYFMHSTPGGFLDDVKIFEVRPNGEIYKIFNKLTSKVRHYSSDFLGAAKGFVKEGVWKEVIVRKFTHPIDNAEGWEGFSHIEIYPDGSHLVMHNDLVIGDRLYYTLDICERAVKEGRQREVTDIREVTKCKEEPAVNDFSRILFISKTNAFNIYTCLLKNREAFIKHVLKNSSINLVKDFIEVIVYDQDSSQTKLDFIEDLSFYNDDKNLISISKELYNYVTKYYDEVRFDQWPQKFQDEFDALRKKSFRCISYKSTDNGWCIVDDDGDCYPTNKYRFTSDSRFEIY